MAAEGTGGDAVREQICNTRVRGIDMLREPLINKVSRARLRPRAGAGQLGRAEPGPEKAEMSE